MIGSVETASICGIVFVAALVRSTLGFGEAIIAMPLLALVVPLQVAAPLVALVSVCNGVAILIREWRHISFRAAMRLIVPGVVAIPFGVWLLRSGDDRIAKGLLAIVIVCFSIWSLRRPASHVLKTDRWAPLAGVLAGFLGGAYNTSGPPLVIYGTLRRWPPDRFRAMLQSYFTVGSLWILSMHFLSGLITRKVLANFSVCVPLVLAATIIGHRICRSLPTERFVFVVHIALLLIGVLLLASMMWHG